MSLLAYTFFNKNVLFYLFCACQLLGLIAAVIVYSNCDSLVEASVPLWMYYVFMGAGYCIADIVIVETSSIQKTEIVLSIGYLIEFLPVTVIQYCRFYSPSAVYYIHDSVLTFKAHIISFICATVVLTLLFLINMPKTKGKSLLDIRNQIFGIKLIKQLILPTSTYELRTLNYTHRSEPPAATTYPFEVTPVYQRQKKSETKSTEPSFRIMSIDAIPTSRSNERHAIDNNSSDTCIMNPSNIVTTTVIGGSF